MVGRIYSCACLEHVPHGEGCPIAATRHSLPCMDRHRCCRRREVGILFFREPASFWRIFFIITLILSIIGLKIVSGGS